MTVRGPIAEQAEVVVVGAGPAGSVAAARLAELGHEVLIVDKDGFPREKPCGDGLMQPAVAAAQRLGLGGLIDSRPRIEAARLVFGHRRHETIGLRGTEALPHPRCIGRAEFDAALLDAARERGARFLRARVDGLDQGEGGWRLAAVSGGRELAVEAGSVVVADGATSRLRRDTSALRSKPRAYAVRQYFVSERPLDPVFDFYLPLEVDGQVLSGYGWVFPVDEHRANVGVGFYRNTGHRPPSLSDVLRAFVAELRVKAGHRFGDLAEAGEPFGSPLGIRPEIEESPLPGVFLVGDAAGTTHPLTGEGIAFAMRGAEATAQAIHRSGSRRAVALRRIFPQLGVDVSMLDRVWSLEASKGIGAAGGSASRPFLGTVKRIVEESAYETAARDTLAWRALSAVDPLLAESLERANDLLLDDLADRLPFVTEVVHYCSRSHFGPVYGAVSLAAVGGGGGDLPGAALDAAVAAECVSVLPELLTMLVNRAHSKSLKVNNAFAILTADFAATRALRAASRIGAPAVTALGRACQRGCEGGMRDSVARFAADRDAESWFRAAAETAGAAAGFAAELGLLLGGGQADPESSRRFGIELGTALRLAAEIVELTLHDELHPGWRVDDLRRGTYPLPLLYAVEADPSLPRMLACHSAEGGDPAEILAVVGESGALRRAHAECEARAAAARSIAAELPGGEALAALAAVPTDHLAAQAGLEAAA